MTVNVESSRITLPKLKTFELDGQREGWTLARLLQEERVLEESAKSGNYALVADLAKLRTEIGERLAFPLMCLAVSIVAAPVGARALRSGRSYTFASGLVIVAAYFILRAVLKDAKLPSLETAILVTQVPNLVLIAVGMLFLWRVDRV